MWWLKGFSDTALQIRVFRIASDFFIQVQQRSWAVGLDLQSGFEDKIQDNFPILKILKFDTGLNKILPCSAAKSRTFGLKNKNLMLMYWLPCQNFKY